MIFNSVSLMTNLIITLWNVRWLDSWDSWWFPSTALPLTHSRTLCSRRMVWNCSFTEYAYHELENVLKDCVGDYALLLPRNKYLLGKGRGSSTDRIVVTSRQIHMTDGFLQPLPPGLRTRSCRNYLLQEERITTKFPVLFLYTACTYIRRPVYCNRLKVFEILNGRKKRDCGFT
jgi:hypothetical protein